MVSHIHSHAQTDSSTESTARLPILHTDNFIHHFVAALGRKWQSVSDGM